MLKKTYAADPIREATIDALKRVVDSLLELMFETGITVQQFNYVDAGIGQSELQSSRVLKETGRSSKSRVAIITGLPRSEVTKIASEAGAYLSAKLGQSAARRVLAAWFETASYLNPGGEPATLSIFGNKRSFEKLVYAHGGGIPVRAMLDELIQLGTVEQSRGQPRKGKIAYASFCWADPRSRIDTLGQRCSDLMQTLMKNVRRRGHPLFEATALVQDADFDLMPVIRREISRQGTSFMNGTNSFLKSVPK